MTGPEKGESGAGRRERRKAHAGKDASCADISGRGGEEGVMACMARLGPCLNCVSGADQASDRSPEQEISDSPPGIGIHRGGKRQ